MKVIRDASGRFFSLTQVIERKRFSMTSPELSRMPMRWSYFRSTTRRREPEELAVTSADLVRSMHHSRGRATGSMDDAVELLDSELKSGDMVLLMGAGDVNERGPRFTLRIGGAR